MIEQVRVLEMPVAKMVASPCGMFGQGVLEAFAAWFSALPRSLFPRDFLSHDAQRGGYVWYVFYEAWMTVPPDCAVVDFPGGLYAVVTGVDGADNRACIDAVSDFLRAHPQLTEDPSRPALGNIATPPGVHAALGYEQMDYYFPVRLAR